MSDSGRDLRLDFACGLSLVFIYVNHVWSAPLSWLTTRNYGFSDATEIFVFISGYVATLAYRGVLERRGAVVTTARIYRRVWRLYVAHVFVFFLYVAQISYVSTTLNTSVYAEETGVLRLFDEPHVMLTSALVLGYRPANLDILPLYIVLLLCFPLVLVGLVRAPGRTLAVSFALYVLASVVEINLPGAPGAEGSGWYFNPFCWQFLFVLAGYCAMRRTAGRRIVPAGPWPVALGVAMILFAFYVTLTWHVPSLSDAVPPWLARLIYPISKTDMDPLRLLHFCALAVVVARVVPPTAGWLSTAFAREVRRLGEKGLEVFCLGVILSLMVHFVLTEIEAGPFLASAITLAGVLGLAAVARLSDWYEKVVDGAPRKTGAVAR